jgi:hypothetical protein
MVGVGLSKIAPALWNGSQKILNYNLARLNKCQILIILKENSKVHRSINFLKKNLFIYAIYVNKQ